MSYKDLKTIKNESNERRLISPNCVLKLKSYLTKVSIEKNILICYNIFVKELIKMANKKDKTKIFARVLAAVLAGMMFLSVAVTLIFQFI